MTARGTVVGVRPTAIAMRLPGASVGAIVRIRTRGRAPLLARIVGTRSGEAEATPLGDASGVREGDAVDAPPACGALPLGMPLLGRALAPDGALLDGGPAAWGALREASFGAPAPGERAPVDRPLWTGIRAIDALLTLGRGARLGLFGEPGAGKSTLLQQLVAGVRADAVVVGLIGERGREAERWIALCDARTTIVCATGERSAGERVRAAEIACAQAARLRERGLDVLLVLDSLARAVAAAREIAIDAGEAVGRGGYPPSVFAFLARLVESAGATNRGSVTLVATVLSDGGDEREPVSDAARAALDGHILLDPRLARAGRYPAIDVLRSASRVMGDVCSAEHREAAARVRAQLARLAATADARSLGIAVPDPAVMRAVEAEPALHAFLAQAWPGEDPVRTLSELVRCADRGE